MLQDIQTGPPLIMLLRKDLGTLPPISKNNCRKRYTIAGNVTLLSLTDCEAWQNFAVYFITRQYE